MLVPLYHVVESTQYAVGEGVIEGAGVGIGIGACVGSEVGVACAMYVSDSSISNVTTTPLHVVGNNVGANVDDGSGVGG